MYFKIRSNHNRIVQLTGQNDAEIEQQKDSPLKLKSTENWKKKGRPTVHFHIIPNVNLDSPAHCLIFDTTDTSVTLFQF